MKGMETPVKIMLVVIICLMLIGLSFIVATYIKGETNPLFNMVEQFLNEIRGIDV